MGNFMKKKVLSLVCVICIFLSTLASVSYAYTDVSDKVLLDLKAFGILTGDDSGDLKLDDFVTRAEFAKMTVEALDASEVSGLECNFTDVDSGAWYYNAVALLSSMGLINGYDDGTFRPNENVSLEEAIKITVCALGYYTMGEKNGGYPDGYRKTAESLGLMKSVSPDGEYMLRRDIARLLYNALDIDRMIIDPGTGKYETNSGDTLRELHLQGIDEEMKSGRGVITANIETWLDRENGALRNDEVEINGEVYKVGDTNAISLLGQEVDYYAQSADRGYVLTAVTPTNKNETFTIDDEQFEGFREGRLRYRLEKNDRERSYALSDSVRIVKNLVPLNDVIIDDLTLDYGTIKVIDNNGDSKADVVFIEDIKTFAVDRVKGSRIYFADSKKLMDRDFIELDEENDDVKFSLSNTDGTAVDISEIEENNIVSIVLSDDASRIKCIVSKESVTGTITSISNTESIISIDGQEYKTSGADIFADENVRAGYNITAYLDFRGNIAWTEIGSVLKQYAYVLNASKYTEGDIYFSLKCLLPGKMQTEEMDVNSDNENDDSTVPILKAGNSAYKVIDLANTVSVNGVQYKGEKRENALGLLNEAVIEYTLNSDGEIIRVEFPKRVGNSGVYKKYNAYERVFGGYENGVFGIDDNSIGICVPTNVINNNDDYLATVRLEDSQRYTVSGYNLDENTYNAELIVLRETLDIKASAAINDYSRIAISKELTTVLTEDEETAYKIVFYSEGEEKEYIVPLRESIASEVGRLQVGTVFYYATTMGDELSRVEIVEYLKTLSSTYDDGTSATERMVYAELLNVDTNTLNDINFRRVNRLYLGVDSIKTTVDLNRRNPPDLYLYDRVTGVVKPITVDEVEPDWNSTAGTKVFAHIKYNKVKGLILIKG